MNCGCRAGGVRVDGKGAHGLLLQVPVVLREPGASMCFGMLMGTIESQFPLGKVEFPLDLT